MSSPAEIAAMADPGQRMVHFKRAVGAAVTASNADGLVELMEAVFGGGSTNISAAVAAEAAQKLNECNDNAFVADAIDKLLPKLAEARNAVAAADLAMRKTRYEICVADEDWSGAALALMQAISVPAAEKAAHWVLVAEVWIKDQNFGNADQALQTAQSGIKDADWGSQMRYNVCKAGVYDLRRKFLNAAQGYLELSQMNDERLDEGELITFLNKAAICVCLCVAGPRRQRLMGIMIRDERVESIAAHAMLDKMFKQHIVTPEDASKFKALLEPHQTARTTAGTVLERAVREHNIVAASKIYQNISFGSLGALVGVDAEVAEQLAATMIQDGRLQGSIDQLEETVAFEDPAAAGGPLLQWDAQLRGVCQGVSSVFDRISNLHPEVTEAVEAAAEAQAAQAAAAGAEA